MRHGLLAAGAFAAAVAVVIVTILSGPARGPRANGSAGAAADAQLDPGTALSRAAPGFTLSDQFGRTVSLRSLRGRVVLLAFVDPRSAATGALTTATMVAARRLVGSAGSSISLVAVDADPLATSPSLLRAYSQARGLLHRWTFLAGPPGRLRRVWRAYDVSVQRRGDLVDATPALFVIDAAGRLRRLYVSQLSYAAVGTQAGIVARYVASLLPGGPALKRGPATVAAIGPTATVTMPRLGGGSVHLAAGQPHLLLFYATWLSATSDLRRDLASLGAYAPLAAAHRLPPLLAVDEAAVEPSPATTARLAVMLPPPRPYPVAVDTTGQVADGYLVQDLAWFVLVSRSGAILWYWDAGTQGWPNAAKLASHVRAALAVPATSAPPTAAETKRLLAGSPAALATIHAHGGRLLGGYGALTVRLSSLRGYPVVLNAWASWCAPCRTEYPLFASAAARYGREVAFLGVDTDDVSAAAARAFLAAHPLSYPSYRSSSVALTPLAAIIGLPTTIFIDRTGAVACVRPGQYDAQGALDDDIASCALRG